MEGRESPLRTSVTEPALNKERWSDSASPIKAPESFYGEVGDQLGVVRAGYLHTGASKWERTNAALAGSVKLRYVVLTHVSLSWFKRGASDVLFGDERGSLSLGEISRASLGLADPRRVELYGHGGSLRRWFLCRGGEDQALEWRDAIEKARADYVDAKSLRLLRRCVLC